MERRYFPHLAIVVVTVVLFSFVNKTHAQDGFCPPNSQGVGVPAGTGFWVFDFCSYDTSIMNIATDNGDDFPCTQYFMVRASAGTNTSSEEFVPIAHDELKYLSEMAHLRFFVFTIPKYNTGGLIPPGYAFHATDDIITVSYFDSNGNLHGASQTAVANYWYATVYRDVTLGRQYYNVYLVDTYIATDDGYGGYFQVAIDQPDFVGTNGSDYHPTVDWGISSFRVGSQYDYLQDMCPLSGTPPTTTPYPTPTIPATWTPNGTATATPIMTPGATSPAITPVPSPTQTPIIYSTLAAESTATPWPIPQLAPLSFPTMDIPTVPTLSIPDSVEVTVESSVMTTEERATITWSMAGDAVAIATSWAEPLDWSLASLDVNQTITSSFSGTVQIDSPQTMVRDSMRSITYPIRMIRTVEAYMPNMWWLLVVIFSGFIISFFMIVIRLALTVIVEVIEIIRRIWEAIPLN